MTNNDSPRRVILLGPPGAGKGTQAQAVASTLDVPHISTGDIFRRNVNNGTSLGRQAKAFMDRGELVPDELTVTMVRARLADGDATAGFLLDGFPRNIDQARFLEQALDEAAARIDVVVDLRVAEDDIVRRLAGRRTCQQCGGSWHVEFHRPRVAGTCDLCAGTLHQRDDDRDESVRRRLALYAEETLPLTAFYRERGVLVPVDASGPVDDVRHRIIAAL